MADPNDLHDNETTLRGLADPLLELARERAQNLIAETQGRAQRARRALETAGSLAASALAHATRATTTNDRPSILQNETTARPTHDSPSENTRIPQEQHGGAQGETLPELSIDFDNGLEWQAREVRIDEGLCALYTLTIDLAHRDVDADPDALLEATVCVVLRRGELRRRWWCTVHRVEHQGYSGHHRLARVFAAPSLWKLTQRRDLRVFQDQTSVEITRAVLHDAGFAEPYLADRLTASVSPRAYCVQHRESDLEFITRVLTEDGVTWMLEQNDHHEVMALVDQPVGWGQIATYNHRPLGLSGPDGGTNDSESISRFEFHRALGPTGVTLRDYDYTRPTHDFTHRSGHSERADREVYDHPGRYRFTPWSDSSNAWQGDSGERDTRAAWERETALSEGAEGVSNVVDFMPGRRFVVDGYEGPREHETWMLTRVRHEAHLPEVLANGHRREDDRDRYKNSFEAVPTKAPWRPALPAKPRVHGLQTAVVVGPEGEDIYTDAQGRVKVQFHWDRHGTRDAHSSCWVRVAQSLAGEHFGALFIPRIGMEVLVDFIDGDPDRPVVTSTVYNRLNLPPEELPEHRSRTTLRTQSTPGHHGYNELRFEDRAGAEEVYLRAQRDLNVNVLCDRSMTVGVDEKIHIGRDQETSAGRDLTVNVTRNQSHTIQNDRRALIVHDDSVQIMNNQFTDVCGFHCTTAKRIAVCAGLSNLIVDNTRGMSVVVHNGRSTTIVGGDLSTLDTRSTQISGQENLSVGSLALTQNNTTLTLSNDTTELAGGGRITVHHSNGKLDIGNDGAVSLASDQTLALSVGNARIDLSTSGIALSFGNARIDLSTSGIALSFDDNRITIDSLGVNSHGSLVTLD